MSIELPVFPTRTEKYEKIQNLEFIWQVEFQSITKTTVMVTEELVFITMKNYNLFGFQCGLSTVKYCSLSI